MSNTEDGQGSSFAVLRDENPGRSPKKISIALALRGHFTGRQKWKAGQD